MEEVAAEAGFTRQTIYAHFASREALVDAAIDCLSNAVTAAVDESGLDTDPPEEALPRFLLLGWDSFERYPSLLALSAADRTGPGEARRHAPVLERLTRLILRGQRAGVFDRRLPAPWLASTIAAIAHAAGEQVLSGLMRQEQAKRALQTSVMRVVGVRQGPGPKSGRRTRIGAGSLR